MPNLSLPYAEEDTGGARGMSRVPDCGDAAVARGPARHRSRARDGGATGWRHVARADEAVSGAFVKARREI